MSVRVRPGSAADRTFVEDLCVSTAASNMSSLRPAPLPLAEAGCERLMELLFANPHTLLIAEEDGVPLGFIIVLDQIPDEVTGMRQAFIAYTAVVEDRRGQGIGRALLTAAEENARRSGLAYIALMVTDENTPAMQLYESFGYATERRLLCKSL